MWIKEVYNLAKSLSLFMTEEVKSMSDLTTVSLAKGDASSSPAGGCILI